VIERYRRRLERAVKGKEVEEIESIFLEIEKFQDQNDKDDPELYHNLRLEIIKAQICVQEFYQWKNAIRNYTTGNSKSLFQMYMVKEKLNRKRWGMDLKKK
jgi:hypothetical protein